MRAGFIGLGHIGASIAQGVIETAAQTTVFDVSPQASGRFRDSAAAVAPSPAAVAAESDVVGICVRDDEDVREVMSGPDGLLDGARPGMLVLIHSTIRPGTVHEVAEQASRKGVRIVDAPVSRAVATDEPFKAVYMLGGAPEDMPEARAFLQATARDIVEAGGLGAGMALKICNNLVTYLEMMAGNEAHRLALSVGLDPSLLLRVMTGNGNATPTMQQVMRTRIAIPGPMEGEALAGFAPMAALGEKDLDCALAVAAENGLALPAATLARDRIRDVFLGPVNA